MSQEQAREIAIVGRPISPGVVIGSAFVYHDRLEALAGTAEVDEGQVAEELQRLERATATVSRDLRLSAQRIEADTNAKLAAIFEAHHAMLLDPGLGQEIRELIQAEWISAAHALVRVFRRRERAFRKMTEAIHQHHADDVADLGRRLLRELAGVQTTQLEKMPSGRVLVARRLLPSDTVALPRRSVAGIVVEFGGPGSHAALLAEALGIPTVAQVPNVTEQVADQDVLIVDGARGMVVVHPSAGTQDSYAELIQQHGAARDQAIAASREPAVTIDGTCVTVLANVGCREDVVNAAAHGAEGVGLYRLEQFYLSRRTPPSETELVAELRKVFEPMQGRAVTVRLLDLGGDKPLPFLNLPAEDNPFLGRRGVRLLLRFPDLLATQLDALCAVARNHDVRILVPMVTVVAEMAEVRARLVAAARAAGLPHPPPLGAMIETPAAALCVPEIIAHADFLSIGTNDLTQYTMAAGRENPLVCDYFLEDHPAVLRLVRLIVEEAGDVPVAVCGELARDLNALPALLQTGIRTLSVPPPLVPGIKAGIRQVNLVQAKNRAA